MIGAFGKTAMGSWDERLTSWYEDLKRRLQKRWWLWPVLLAFDLCWHYAYEKMIEFLQSHATSLHLPPPLVLRYVPSSPATTTLTIAILVILVLIVLSYFETRAKPQIAATINLAILDVVFERSSSVSVIYKSKVRVVLRNNTGREIRVGVARWIAEPGDVPIQQPAASTLQLEGESGWETSNWGPESQEIAVRNGMVFRTWIGLKASISDDDLRRRHETLRLGVFVIPVDVSGQRNEFRRRL